MKLIKKALRSGTKELSCSSKVEPTPNTVQFEHVSHSREARQVKVDRWPSQKEFRRCWSNLLQTVSATSAVPKEALRLMKEIGTAKCIEDFEDDVGLDTLWAKLRAALQKSIKRAIPLRNMK